MPSLAHQHRIDNLSNKAIQYSHVDINKLQEDNQDKAKTCKLATWIVIKEIGGNIVRTRF